MFLEERPILRNILYLVTLLLVEGGNFRSYMHKFHHFQGSCRFYWNSKLNWLLI